MQFSPPSRSLIFLRRNIPMIKGRERQSRRQKNVWEMTQKKIGPPPTPPPTPPTPTPPPPPPTPPPPPPTPTTPPPPTPPTPPPTPPPPTPPPPPPPPPLKRRCEKKS